MSTTIPTPPSSSIAPSNHPSPLPQPRKHPLRPGGPKESELIRYLDHGVNGVVKKVENRVNYRNRMRQAEEEEDGKRRKTEGDERQSSDQQGFKAFWQVAKEIEGLVDVVWVSGSPNLQVPYLLNLAVLLTEYLPYFSPAPRATFRLLTKLDAAFSSLLLGRDVDTGEYLPGFENGRTISTTDKVRLKGIVDRTRLTVVKVMTKETVVGDDDEEDEPEPMDADTDMDEKGDDGLVKFEGFENNDDDEDDDEEDEWEEQMIARVYEKTIGELGDVLGGPPIGIITDD